MPGSRTAPDVAASATFIEISLRWIDAIGDVRSDTSLVDATATDAEIEAVAVKMQAGSNSSLWEVKVSEVYEGAKSKGNALAAVRESLQTNVVYHAKNTARVDRRAYLPSPIAAVFVTDTETPDTTNSVFTELFTAWLAVWKGTFASVSLRLTERREINERQQI